MCLIAFAYKVHPDYPLLLVANRDEFHARAAAPLAWWKDAPRILAGRDLQEGGSWLGVSRSGRMAAVTNVRSPDAMLRRTRSRGQLVTQFLEASSSSEDFAAALEATATEFGGFNLLLYDGSQLHYTSNHPHFVSRGVEPGTHALSNAQLDTPWPKTATASLALQDWLERDLADEARLLSTMGDTQPAPDEALPLTGIGHDMERLLSSAFIRSDTYGTRCTSLLKISEKRSADFFERRYDASGQTAGEIRETFRLERRP